MAVKKLSISVSEELLQKVDKARSVLGESRSGLIQRLLICWMQETGLQHMDRITQPRKRTNRER